MTAERSLADTFRRLIATTGPLTLAHYMAEANARYYA
jgi:NADH dehydrogenase [ubiquinone] 1 alpha subcomplex assembly factor 7